MREVFILIAGLLCGQISFSQAAFDRFYGGLQDDFGESVVALADGNFAVCGATNSGIGTGMDVWLMKLDGFGDTLWSQSYELMGAEQAKTLIATRDGGFFMAGSTSQNHPYLYYLKTDSAGVLEWWGVTTWGTETWAEAALETPDGNFLVAGGTLLQQPGPDDWDPVIFAFDSLGNQLWRESYPQTTLYQFNALTLTANGGIVAVGNTTVGGNSALYGGLVRMDATGHFQGWREYGAPYYTELWDVLALPNGNLQLCGFSFFPTGNGNGDAWLLQTDAVGDTLWTRRYGGPKFDAFRAMHALPGGQIALTGGTESEGAGFSDVWVVATDSVGDSLWSRTFGGIPPDEGKGLAVLPGGDLLVVGSKGNFTVQGKDLYVVRLHSGGAIAVEPGISIEPLTLFPNPAQSHLSIHPYSSPFTYSLIHSTGKVVATGQFTGQPIGLEHLPSGSYFLHIIPQHSSPQTLPFFITR